MAKFAEPYIEVQHWFIKLIFTRTRVLVYFSLVNIARESFILKTTRKFLSRKKDIWPTSSLQRAFDLAIYALQSNLSLIIRHKRFRLKLDVSRHILNASKNLYLVQFPTNLYFAQTVLVVHVSGACVNICST